MRRRWTLLPREPELAHQLATELRLHPILGHLLVNRGVRSSADAQRFLDRKLTGLHDPADLPGVAEAADRLFAAAQAGRRICVYGDYDVDGMSATAILVRCLRLAGADPRWYVPHRVDEGYGVHAPALERLHADGVETVVSVDCGIASLDAAQRARELGLEYIVTDHHEFADELPDADVVVHPRLPGSRYPFGELCGAGVAFKLAWEIGRRFSGGRKTTERFQQLLLDMTTLAGLATVCDVVPLLGENRVLVHHGLQSLRRTPPVGLAALLGVTGLDQRPTLTASDLGYTIGPRLNACGRLGHASLGVELLLTDDPARATQLAEQFDAWNRERQSLERKLFTEARAEAERLVALDAPDALPIVLGSEQWHSGIIGIAAGRLAERFHRPCLLVSFREGMGHGSGRSVPGFDLRRALASCSDVLEACGGHAMAAGVRVRQECFEAFRDRLREVSAGAVPPPEDVGELRVDAEVPLHTLTPSLLGVLDGLGPFGAGNPPPLLLATELDLVGAPRRIGGGERHLAFRVRQHGTSLRAVAFGMGERAEELVQGDGRCCVLFRPQLNHYQGRVSVEMHVEDFRPGARVDEEHMMAVG